MPDQDKIDNAMWFNRTALFWFSRRQPRYQDDFTTKWGEEWDDTIFRPEELDAELDK